MNKDNVSINIIISQKSKDNLTSIAAAGGIPVNKFCGDIINMLMDKDFNLNSQTFIFGTFAILNTWNDDISKIVEEVLEDLVDEYKFYKDRKPDQIKDLYQTWLYLKMANNDIDSLKKFYMSYLGRLNT